MTLELPLAFVAQIDLAEIAAFDVEHVLPDSGLLSFFSADAIHLMRAGAGSCPGWEEAVDAPDRARVLYTPPGTELAPLRPPAELDADLVSAASAVTFAPVDTWPQLEGPFIGGPGDGRPITFSTEEEWDRWEREAPEPPACAMLGHPRGAEGPIGDSPDSYLLLSLDERSSGLSYDLFGRNGYLYFYAPLASLRARDWSAVRQRER